MAKIDNKINLLKKSWKFEKINMLSIGILFLIPLTGCVSESSSRGWLGGRFLETPTKSFIHSRHFYKFDRNLPFVKGLPELIAKQQTRAIFVDRIYDGTPVCEAGLKDSDVIFKINGKIVDDFEEFREIIDKSAPGDNLKFSIYRNGNVIEKNVIVGRETYSSKSQFNFGIMLSNTVVLSYSDFSIFNLLGYQINNPRRPELHSPEFHYLKKLNPKLSQKTKNKPGYTKWMIFIPFFAYSSREFILEQVSVKPRYISQKKTDKEKNKAELIQNKIVN